MSLTPTARSAGTSPKFDTQILIGMGTFYAEFGGRPFMGGVGVEDSYEELCY
jgi:hypothetical protein